MGGPEFEPDGGDQGPVIRDRRKLDPETGQVREPSAPAPEEPAAPIAGLTDPGVLVELAVAEALAAERLEDLQRLQAEYVNYRRRVDRDRDVAKDAAVLGVLEALLPVLDDIHLARTHGDLDGGPFAAIAEKLDGTLTRFGLEQYGAVGEQFDPTVHDALLHVDSSLLPEGATGTTVVQVLQPGYRTAQRVIRAARVAVADPE